MADLQHLCDFITSLPGGESFTGEGWHVKGIQRKTGGQVDKYFFAPDGTRLRSRLEVARYLGLREGGGGGERKRVKPSRSERREKYNPPPPRRPVSFLHPAQPLRFGNYETHQGTFYSAKCDFQPLGSFVFMLRNAKRFNVVAYAKRLVDAGNGEEEDEVEVTFTRLLDSGGSSSETGDRIEIQYLDARGGVEVIERADIKKRIMLRDAATKELAVPSLISRIVADEKLRRVDASSKPSASAKGVGTMSSSTSAANDDYKKDGGDDDRGDEDEENEDESSSEDESEEGEEDDEANADEGLVDDRDQPDGEDEE